MLLHERDVERLLKFYLSLDGELRRARFCAAMSDASIAQHCRSIDWNRSIIIGNAGRHGLDAVVEIHPLSLQWVDADLTVVCHCHSDRTHILATLFQVAAFAAGKRGCARFIVLLDGIGTGVLPFLDKLAKVRIEDCYAYVDLTDYRRADSGPGSCIGVSAPVVVPPQGSPKSVVSIESLVRRVEAWRRGRGSAGDRELHLPRAH